MRDTIAAGKLYPDTQVETQQLLNEAYEKGPGALPTKKKDNSVKAIISPIAKYSIAAPTASWGFKELAETPQPDAYIIVCDNHFGSESGITMEPFSTPSGIVRVDQKLARAIIEKGTISENPAVHVQEFGIEVQLPYLQFSQTQHFKILPIVLGQDIDNKKLALDIKESLLEQKKTAQFIISSDLQHHGSKYNNRCYFEKPLEQLSEVDREFLELYKSKDRDAIAQFLSERFGTFLGTKSLLFLLEFLKEESIRLEHYATHEEDKNIVSFASLVIS